MNNKFFERAFELARTAGLAPLPNPCVGAVVVKDGKIAGEGYTQEYGGRHAENIAIREAQCQAKNAVLYCTLEPCHGKWEAKHQIACTEIIVQSGIKEVHIACKDKNMRIDGNGIAFLQSKNIPVYIHSEFELRARKLNDVFEYLQWAEKRNRVKLPFIHLKIAQSKDKIMASEDKQRIFITGEDSKLYVHKMRAHHQVLITSASTINIDNPKYTVRKVKGANPSIVIIDSHLKISENVELLQTAIKKSNVRRKMGKLEVQVCIFYSDDNLSIDLKEKKIRLESQGIKVQYLPRDEFLTSVLQTIFSWGIYSVMVEAGPKLSAGFLNENLVSKMTILESKKELLKGIKIDDYLKLPFPCLHNKEKKLLGEDRLTEGYVDDIFGI